MTPESATIESVTPESPTVDSSAPESSTPAASTPEASAPESSTSASVETRAATAPSRRAGAPRLLLVMGVGSACLLGVGLGLWARPTDLERPAAPKRVLARLAPPPHHIEIRVSPGPVAAPAPPGPVAAQPVAVAAAAPPAAIAPKAAPASLVTAPAPERAPAPAAVVKAVAAARPAPSPKLVSAPAASAPPVARLARTARPAAKALAAPPPQARVARAQAVAPKRKSEPHARLAAAQPRKPHRLELAERGRPAKHGPGAAGPARADLAPRHARLALAHARRAELARAPARLRRIAEVAPPPAPARHAGLHKVSASRCALPDPAAALVCSDPSLGAAERRLDRAYREAQAAGVPAAQLERQQQRWLAARATAARQAPWAVHDVYVARIAELQDEIRTAQNPD